MDTPSDAEYAFMAQQSINDQTRVQLEALQEKATMTDQERRNAQAWIDYGRRVKDERDALLQTVLWLQNTAHECYHVPGAYAAREGLNVTVTNTVPHMPERVPPSECTHAICQHTTRVLRAVAKPPGT
jgi:hypothetical protein